MTVLSKCILAGYCILHIFFVLLLDRQLKEHFRNRPAYRDIRPAWIIPFAVAAAVPVAGVFFPEGAVSLFLQRIGNVFLAFDLHIAGLFLLLCFISWIVSFFIRNKSAGSRSCIRLPIWLLILVLAAGIIIPVYGMYHAQDTVVHYFQADLRNTDAGSCEKLRIALISDLHLSVNSHLGTTENMVRLVNEQEPDIVLVAGDIFTSSYAALREPEKYAETLARIHAPMGVFAVYGNHDVEETLFSGFAVHPVSHAFRTSQIEQFFEECNFTILYDEVTAIAGGKIQLTGRIDGNKAGDGTRNRLAPAGLLQDTDPSKPLLVLEHEPVQYKELAEAGADMVLSGHTHNGQIFPGNLFIKLMNENPYGQKKLYGMETFVTSGVGTFGPPMRTGTDSEIMIINLLY